MALATKSGGLLGRSHGGLLPVTQACLATYKGGIWWVGIWGVVFHEIVMDHGVLWATPWGLQGA